MYHFVSIREQSFAWPGQNVWLRTSRFIDANIKTKFWREHPERPVIDVSITSNQRSIFDWTKYERQKTEVATNLHYLNKSVECVAIEWQRQCSGHSIRQEYRQLQVRHLHLTLVVQLFQNYSKCGSSRLWQFHCRSGSARFWSPSRLFLIFICLICFWLTKSTVLTTPEYLNKYSFSEMPTSCTTLKVSAIITVQWISNILVV